MELFPRFRQSQGKKPNPRAGGAGAIRQTLFARLEKLGIDDLLVPGFFRSLINSHRVDPHMTLLQINRKLRYLGWKDLNLDYHTWQLAIACIESDGCTPQ
jgi:hypothetical protein